MADPKHMPYCIPERRELFVEELALLRYLLEREAPHRLSEADQLKVVARCGCGACPTVLFGRSLDAEPLTSVDRWRDIACYRGRNVDGVEVGVNLVERDGQLAELEAWAPVGGEVKRWPPLSALRRVSCLTAC